MNYDKLMKTEYNINGQRRKGYIKNLLQLCFGFMIGTKR